MATHGAAKQVTILEEDLLRAQLYGLLGRLLAAPPDAALLELAAGLEGDDTPLGQGLSGLARMAAGTTPAVAGREYHDLFIGLARGELLPYGSFYRTGFLNEKPLAVLRQDMARLGIARAASVKEPEDHIAALCEMMAGLIVGDFGAPADAKVQRQFFGAHLAPWAGRFFADLEGAKSASFYAPVGTIGRLFFEIEDQAFEMTP